MNHVSRLGTNLRFCSGWKVGLWGILLFEGHARRTSGHRTHAGCARAGELVSGHHPPFMASAPLNARRQGFTFCRSPLPATDAPHAQLKTRSRTPAGRSALQQCVHAMWARLEGVESIPHNTATNTPTDVAVCAAGPAARRARAPSDRSALSAYPTTQART